VADLTAIRQALAAVLNGVGPVGSGCRASANFVGTVNPPAAIVTLQPGANFTTQTFEGSGQYNLRITLLAAAGSDESADALLDAWLSTRGDPEVSILSALAANPNLGGACDWCVVSGVHGYGWIEWGGIQYLGCNLLVSIGAT
jgi:hypothetical protein